MAMVFVSLIGKQNLALLNPLRAIIEHYNAPDHIYLLATPHAIDLNIHSLEAMKEIHELSATKMTIYPISHDLKEDEAGNLPPQKILKEIFDLHAEDMILFNMTPGLKFQIIACIHAIDARDIMLVYAERDGIHVYQITKGKLESHTVVSIPEPMNILKLQGIPYERLENRQTNKVFRKAVMELSDKLNKRNIPTFSNIEIEGIFFDLVWNDGNTLSFLTRIDSQSNAKKLIALSANRRRFFDLYHRNIFAFPANLQIAERLANDDSSDKLTVKYYQNKEELDTIIDKDFLNIGRKDPVIQPLTNSKIEKVTNTDKTAMEKTRKNTVLLTLLAPNEIPTLIAIFTHRPEKAILFYTSNNRKISEIKDRMLKYIDTLPIGELQFVPISFMAEEILRLDRCEGMDTEINVGPGHKIAGLFLSLWGAINNGKLFSINNSTNQIEQIPEGEMMECKGARPEFILKLAGNEGVKCGLTEKELWRNRKTYRCILTFIDILKDNPERLKEFPNNSISLFPTAEYIVRKVNNRRITGTIDIPGNKMKTSFLITGGQWFEELVGYQFLVAGAESITVRIRVPWSETSRRALKQHLENVSHRNDLDVMVRFKGKYFMISCKSGIKTGIGQECELTEFHAKSVEHFAIPLVCFLRYTGEPYQNPKTEIYIFGYKTLLNPDSLKTLCEKAYQARQTTAPSTTD